MEDCEKCPDAKSPKLGKNGSQKALMSSDEMKKELEFEKAGSKSVMDNNVRPSALDGEAFKKATAPPTDDSESKAAASASKNGILKNPKKS